jgi:hypothetical protein
VTASLTSAIKGTVRLRAESRLELLVNDALDRFPHGLVDHHASRGAASTFSPK